MQGTNESLKNVGMAYTIRSIEQVEKWRRSYTEQGFQPSEMMSVLFNLNFCNLIARKSNGVRLKRSGEGKSLNLATEKKNKPKEKEKER